MADTATKLPVKARTEKDRAPSPAALGHDWTSMHSLRHEMDRVFDMLGFGRPRALVPRPMLDFDLSFPADPSFAGGIPLADLMETEAGYEIAVELPGIDEKDVEVRLVGDLLTIKGEKKTEKDERRGDRHVSERRFGSFVRSFGLPRGVDTDKIEARFSKGVLKLNLPKTMEALAQERRIEITTA